MGNQNRKIQGIGEYHIINRTSYGEDWRGSRRAEDWTLKSEEKTVDVGEKKEIDAAVDEEWRLKRKPLIMEIKREGQRAVDEE